MITLIDAQGKATHVRNRIRAFGVQHPLTLATAAGLTGLIVGLLFG